MPQLESCAPNACRDGITRGPRGYAHRLAQNSAWENGSTGDGRYHVSKNLPLLRRNGMAEGIGPYHESHSLTVGSSDAEEDVKDVSPVPGRFPGPDRGLSAGSGPCSCDFCQAAAARQMAL